MTAETKERPQPNPELVLANWKHELDAVDLYRYLAGREKDSQRAAILQEMAASEEHHAAVMEQGLQKMGVPLPRHSLSFQTRAIKLIARVLGPRVVYPILNVMEISGTAEYAEQDSATAALAGDERSHARILGTMAEPTGRNERWHRSGGGGTLRASVFGISDGLLSNLSLVMGFAGAQADNKFVVLAGLAGLLAGASSMAAGEYVSMRAQRELFERQIELESAELAVTPDEERREISMIYRAKGLSQEDADRMAGQLILDRGIALDTLVREELGLDPGELGSPWGAAIGSFVSFAIGALIPVLSYLFTSGLPAVAISIAVSGAAVFTVGASLSLFTGRNPLLSGVRQLLIGAVAAVVTFGLGKLIGVSTGV